MPTSSIPSYLPRTPDGGDDIGRLLQAVIAPPCRCYEHGRAPPKSSGGLAQVSFTTKGSPQSSLQD